MNDTQQEDEFESGLDSRRTEKPHDRAVKKGLHVLTHFKAEKDLSPKALALSSEFEKFAGVLATEISPGNILTSALERLLDARNMAIQYMKVNKK